MSTTSVFIDMENLNVLIKVRTKFVAAMSFSNSLHRLFQLLPSLESGYDVYLCVKPRAIGEGNYIVKELSVSGVPFTCNKEELVGCINLFSQQRGIGTVYVCNWLENYATWTRVPDCRSVIYYGDRVALLDVEDHMTKSLRMFRDSLTFHDEVDEKDGARLYGDVGLLDVNGILAKFPEFEQVSKAQLTMLIPLIACYNTKCKVIGYELMEQLSGSVNREAEVIEESPTIDVEKEAKQVEVNEVEPQPLVMQTYTRKHKFLPVSIGARVAALFCILLASLFGFTFGVTSNVNLRLPDDQYVAQRLQKMGEYSQSSATLNHALKFPNTRKDLEDTINAAGGSITITGYEYLDGEHKFYCTSLSDVGENLSVAVLSTGESITCLETGTSVNENGDTVFAYTVSAN